jgi:hypothetical protein
MFLRYAIEHELIPPIVRIAIGFATGIAAIAISERLRNREYVTMANALAGTGIVVLYVSSWAAQVLYELVPPTLGFLLMILVTAACGALAWRYKAREIALLGLIGGFATPVLMSTESDNPIGLFGYVLLLDVGLIWLARIRRWPLLMILALLGTFFYEAVWILSRMGPDRTLIGLGVLLLFGLLFKLGDRVPKVERGCSQAGRHAAPRSRRRDMGPVRTGVLLRRARGPGRPSLSRCGADVCAVDCRRLARPYRTDAAASDGRGSGLCGGRHGLAHAVKLHDRARLGSVGGLRRARGCLSHLPRTRRQTTR